MVSLPKTLWSLQFFAVYTNFNRPNCWFIVIINCWFIGIILELFMLCIAKGVKKAAETSVISSHLKSDMEIM